MKDKTPDQIKQLSFGEWELVLSAGTPEDQAKRVATVRRVSEKTGRHTGIMGDLQGPKIRIESFKNGPVTLAEGAEFLLDTAMDPNGGDEHAVGVAYRNLVKDVAQGDVVLLDDGLIVLEVEQVEGTKKFFRELNRLGLTGVYDPGGKLPALDRRR